MQTGGIGAGFNVGQVSSAKSSNAAALTDRIGKGLGEIARAHKFTGLVDAFAKIAFSENAAAVNQFQAARGDKPGAAFIYDQKAEVAYSRMATMTTQVGKEPGGANQLITQLSTEVIANFSTRNEKSDHTGNESRLQTYQSLGSNPNFSAKFQFIQAALAKAINTALNAATDPKALAIQLLVQLDADLPGCTDDNGSKVKLQDVIPKAVMDRLNALVATKPDSATDALPAPVNLPVSQASPLGITHVGGTPPPTNEDLATDFLDSLGRNTTDLGIEFSRLHDPAKDLLNDFFSWKSSLLGTYSDDDFRAMKMRYALLKAGALAANSSDDDA